MKMNLILTHIGCAKSSSDYKWFSSDTNIVSVSAYGVVQAKKPGKSTVKVVSLFDSLNYDEVINFCSPPFFLVFSTTFCISTCVLQVLLCYSALYLMSLSWQFML